MLYAVREFLKRPLIWQSALACYWLAMLVGTHVPSQTGLLPPDGSDKLVHMAAFAGLAALVAITWQLAAGQLIRPKGRTPHGVWRR